jgi:DNA-binding response OmpR family regulator
MIGYLVLVPADQQPLLPVPDEPGGRPEAAPQDSDTATDALVRIDGTQRTAQVDGRQLDLTYLEFELLAHLVAHPHRVHTRDQLVTTVWGYGHVGDGRTVDVHVARLRRKLGAEHRQVIQTVRRVGYKYAPPATR